MKSRLISSVIVTLLITMVAEGSINLNSSRSNIYRLTYPTDLVSRAQAHKILADLDKMGPADEEKLKHWLPANFKRYGIEGARVKKLIILPRSKDLKEIAVILLTNPADEPEARAVTVKSSKSNSSD
ncbi:MAG: hypothetical protein ACXW19_04185 [Thermoanaerobaculia bacterium]